MSPAGLSSDSAIPVWWVSCFPPRCPQQQTRDSGSPQGTRGTAGLHGVHHWTRHVRPHCGGGSQERIWVVLVQTWPSWCPASASPAMPRQMPSSCAAGRGYHVWRVDHPQRQLLSQESIPSCLPPHGWACPAPARPLTTHSETPIHPSLLPGPEVILVPPSLSCCPLFLAPPVVSTFITTFTPLLSPLPG